MKEIATPESFNVSAPKLVKNKCVQAQIDGRLVTGFDVVVRSQEAAVAK